MTPTPLEDRVLLAERAIARLEERTPTPEFVDAAPRVLVSHADAMQRLALGVNNMADFVQREHSEREALAFAIAHMHGHLMRQDDRIRSLENALRRERRIRRGSYARRQG